MRHKKNESTLMKLRNRALAVALVTAAVPSLATSADAAPRSYYTYAVGAFYIPDYTYGADPVYIPAYSYEYSPSYAYAPNYGYRWYRPPVYAPRVYRPRVFAWSSPRVVRAYAWSRPAVVVRRHWVRY